MRWILRQRWWVVTLWLVAAAVAAPGALRLRIDNSPETYFVQDAEALTLYRRFTAMFGDLAAMRVAFEGPGVWTPEGLAWIGELESRLPLLPGVTAAAGLYGRHRGRQRGWPPPDPAAFRETARGDRLNRRAGWVSDDGRMVTLLVAHQPMVAAERRSLIAALDGLGGEAPAGVEVSVAGLASLEQALDDGVLEVARILFPFLVLVTAGLLFAVFGTAGQVARTLLPVALCQLTLFGIMGWARASLDMVTLVLIPLIFVLALAAAIHVVYAWRRHRRTGLDGPGAVVATYREKAWPLFWTGVTTWVGFGSMQVNPVPPMRSLGFWLAVGIALLTLAAFTLLPALLAGAPSPRERPFERRAAALGRALGRLAANRRRAIVTGFAAAALLLLAGAGRLTLGIGLLDYFRPGQAARSQVERLEGRGIGTVSAELLIAAPDGQTVVDREGPREAEGLARLGAVVEKLRTETAVLGALSAADLLPEARSAEPGGRFFANAVDLLLSAGGDTARISLLIPMAELAELEGLFRRAEREAEAAFPGSRARITGSYPLVLQAKRSLRRSMLLSLSLTGLCVAAVFALILRSAGGTLIALMPNFWAVIVAVGLMGWSGVPIDGATVMIAAVVLGLAVDDTLHFVGRYRDRLAQADPAAAVEGVLEETAGAHLLTTVVLVAGFTVCALSSFLPVSRFGALTALTLAAALAADLLLLPALLRRPASPGPRGR